MTRDVPLGFIAWRIHGGELAKAHRIEAQLSFERLLRLKFTLERHAATKHAGLDIVGRAAGAGLHGDPEVLQRQIMTEHEMAKLIGL